MLKKSVAELDYTVELQKNKIVELSKNNVSTLSHVSESTQLYSTVVQNNETNKQTSPVLIIRSNDQNLSQSEALKQIKQSVNPNELGLKINNTREIKNGLVENCSNQNALNSLNTNLASKVGDKFTINETMNFNPRLKIHKLNKDPAADSDFLQNLIINNNITCKHSDIKLVLTQDRKTHVIIEVSAQVHKSILSVGRLFLGWQSCNVTDHHSIKRCFHCSRYGHTKTQCK